MEVDENIHDPESYFEGLVRQVEEQSELCDITIRAGPWHRKFHRCILNSSPFFQNIMSTHYKNSGEGNAATMPDFIERKKETFSDDLLLDVNDVQAGASIDDIEVKTKASPGVVEMAIMSMYGRSPEFDISNIGDLLELAEHLKMDGLKHACLKWLYEVDYSEVNCMYVMQLSGKYDFDITRCIVYIESHIPQILQYQETYDLTSEDIEYLFTEERFSYVSTDAKLNFLVQWANKKNTESTNTKSTSESIIRLLKTLDLNEVSSQAWDNAQSNTQFNSMVHLDTSLRNSERENSRKPAMIMTSEKNYIACLDLENNRWYRINPKYYKRCQYFEEIAGIRNDNPELYFKVDDILEETMKTVDLHSDQIRSYSIQMEFYYHRNVEIIGIDVTNTHFTNETFIATVKKAFIIYEDADNSEDESESNEIIKVTEVYTGNTSEEEVEMQPLFSFNKEEIMQICMNDQSVLALITKSDGRMHVIMYDLLQFKMERILSLHEGEYALVATVSGFLLHNNIQCYLFTKTATGNYKIEHFMFDNKEGWFVKYKYQSGIWLRILRQSLQNDIELQYIYHEEFLDYHASSFDSKWRNVSMPVDLELFDKLEKFENIFIVNLSRTVLRCDIACPHCKFYFS